jgi:hypothetical protein
MSCHRRLNLRIAPRTQPFACRLLNVFSRAHPSPTRKISVTVLNSSVTSVAGDFGHCVKKIDAYGLRYGSACLLCAFDVRSPARHHLSFWPSKPLKTRRPVYSGCWRPTHIPVRLCTSFDSVCRDQQLWLDCRGYRLHAPRCAFSLISPLSALGLLIHGRRWW